MKKNILLPSLLVFLLCSCSQYHNDPVGQNKSTAPIDLTTESTASIDITAPEESTDSIDVIAPQINNEDRLHELEEIYKLYNEEKLNNENYNDAIYQFYIQDGSLKYTCQPRKYLPNEDESAWLQYSIGKNEIYKIEGNVSFSNDAPFYTIDHITLLSDQYSDDEIIHFFELYRNEVIDQKMEWQWETPESLFEYNAMIYDTEYLNEFLYTEIVSNKYEQALYELYSDNIAVCFKDMNHLTLYAYSIEEGIFNCNRYIYRIRYNNIDILCPHPFTSAPRFFDGKTNGDIFIIGNRTIEEEEPAIYYIFQKENSDSFTYIYNDIVTDGYELDFYVVDNEMRYVKTNSAYINEKQEPTGLITAFSKGSDFYMEYGNVKFIEDELVFECSESMTVEEWFHSDHFHRDRMNCKTMEEFIAKLREIWDC